LAAAVLEGIELKSGARAALGTLARIRVQQHFSLAASARQYEEVYGELTAGCAA
jgi:hypothetical protein